MKVVRTFHLENELDRKMVEAVYQSKEKLTKTKIVNDALREYFSTHRAGKSKKVNNEPSER